MREIIIETPVDCKLFLRYKSNTITQDEEGKEIIVPEERLKEIALTQTLSYRITENKKPVYGFNQERFQQVIKGKKLLEGVIVLKKSLLNQIDNLIDITPKDIADQKNYTEEKLIYLKRNLIADDSIKDVLAKYEDELEDDWLKKKHKYINQKNKCNIFNNLPKGTKIIIAYGSAIISETFQNKLQTIMSKENSLYKVEEAENLIKENSEFIIEDINFIERSSEITISKSDIDEVYKFFGSLTDWEVND